MGSHDTGTRHGRRWLRVVTAVCTVVAATAVGMVIGIPSSQAIVCISGKHPGFNVTSGSVCVEDATITGSINVTNGADLFVNDSVIKGSISGTAPEIVVVCDSKAASVSVQLATEYVEIGDPSDECLGNIIQGGLTVANNNGGSGEGAWVECNRIGGSWLVVNNSDNNIDLGNHHKGNGPNFCNRDVIP